MFSLILNIWCQKYELWFVKIFGNTVTKADILTLKNQWEMLKTPIYK